MGKAIIDQAAEQASRAMGKAGEALKEAREKTADNAGKLKQKREYRPPLHERTSPNEILLHRDFPKLV